MAARISGAARHIARLHHLEHNRINGKRGLEYPFTSGDRFRYSRKYLFTGDQRSIHTDLSIDDAYQT